MRVVDTSAWIEHLVGSQAGKVVRRELPDRSEWLVPTMVQLELSKWLTRERGEEVANQALAFSQLCVVIPLSSEIALAAADACQQHKLATADAVIYATARHYDADLLTCDTHFKELDGVRYVPKSAAPSEPGEAGS